MQRWEYRTVQQIREGASWDQPARTLFGAGGSFGNGAAMRVAPAALFASPDLDAVAELARLQSLVTHTHPLGYEGAILIACAVAHLLQRDASALLNVDDLLGAVGWRLAEPTYQEKLSEIAALLPDASPDIVAARLGNVVVAHLSAPAAVYAFLRSPRAFVETICYAVSLGGDTDTIACMAGALAGAHLGEGAIPDQLLGRVEGVDYVRSLADQLYDLVTAH